MKNNYNAVTSESGCGCLQEVVIYERFQLKGLTTKNLVFWIGGRLWEVVAYKRWSHMEVQL